MTVDTELDVWRREWREETEPFPALKKKIRRQNLRIVGAIVAIAVCLIVSTIEAIRTGNAFVAGLAAGIGFARTAAAGLAPCPLAPSSKSAASPSASVAWSR